MIDCMFALNGEPMSQLKCGASLLPAFSGLGRRVNQPESICLPDEGPIEETYGRLVVER